MLLAAAGVGVQPHIHDRLRHPLLTLALLSHHAAALGLGRVPAGAHPFKGSANYLKQLDGGERPQGHREDHAWTLQRLNTQGKWLWTRLNHARHGFPSQTRVLNTLGCLWFNRTDLKVGMKHNINKMNLGHKEWGITDMGLAAVEAGTTIKHVLHSRLHA